MKLTKQNNIKSILLITMTGLGVPATPQAALIDVGGGMIYDDVLDVTWLQDANYAKTSGYDDDGIMTWDEANDWARSLSIGGYHDWRLPVVKPVNGFYNFSHSDDGSTDQGFNITSPSSELSYMYYVNLGNSGIHDETGKVLDCFYSSSCLANTGLFKNIQTDRGYWSPVLFADTGDADLGFYFNSGWQTGFKKTRGLYAWAVRSDHDHVASVTTHPPVPVPAAFWLFGTGVLALWGRKLGLLMEKACKNHS